MQHHGQFTDTLLNQKRQQIHQGRESEPDPAGRMITKQVQKGYFLSTANLIVQAQTFDWGLSVKGTLCWIMIILWRRGWDLNPRYPFG